MTLEIGQVIDQKYRVTRLLGNGGMGAVYEAHNIRVVRRVAIKVLHAHVCGQADAVTRFEREAQAAGRIGSEHICEVFDLGSLPDGARYMVMEYMEGETLSQRIQRGGRLKAAQVVPLMSQILDGLAAAHEAGIIHRDLKPDNVFLLKVRSGKSDFVKILDFGVSKFSPLGEEMNMTRAGAVIGTPYYMSPEQARGASPIDARSDIYSLGVLLYQAATGVLPHEASTFNELLFKIVMEEPPPPQRFAPDLEPSFSAIIQKAMARDPARRFQTCAEFREALVTWGSKKESVRPPPSGPTPGMATAQWNPDDDRTMRLSPVPPPPALPTGTGATPPPPGATPAAPSVNVQASPEAGAQVPPTSSSWGNTSGEAAGTRETPVPRKPSSKAMPMLVVAAVVIGGGGGAAYFALRGGGSAGTPAGVSASKGGAGKSALGAAAPPAAATTAAPAATPPPVAPAVPSTVAVAATVAEPTLAPDATATSNVTPKGVAGTAPTGGGKSSGKSTATTAATAAASGKKPAGSGVPGDFGY